MSLWLYIIEKMAREIVPDEPEPKLPDWLLGAICYCWSWLRRI